MSDIGAIGIKFKQEAPLSTDGEVRARVASGNRVELSVVNDGVEATIVCSQFNASRMFAMLALMLGIPLPKAVGKAIKL